MLEVGEDERKASVCFFIEEGDGSAERSGNGDVCGGVRDVAAVWRTREHDGQLVGSFQYTVVMPGERLSWLGSP